MVEMRRPQPDARAVGEPQTAFLGLLLWDLQPLPLPDPLDPLEVHRPAGSGQHRRYPAIAVAAILGGERDDVGGESRFVIERRGNLALRGPMLSQNPASQALGHAILGDHMVHAGAATGGAYQFPEAASLRISFSSVRSETARRSRVFSPSNSFSRLT